MVLLIIQQNEIVGSQECCCMNVILALGTVRQKDHGYIVRPCLKNTK
jgi:hypothetical protein